ncbi:MFS transporter OS=Streptomyces fumanus OX=67302 GN=GCM10018772_35450 PE=4 SV=1 [Streptomyces fumanus]
MFDRMVEEGYLTRHGSLLSHTAAGAREAAVIADAWTDWLEDRVERDIGRPSDAEVRVAVDAIAKRLLVEDLSSGLPDRTRRPAGAHAGS